MHQRNPVTDEEATRIAREVARERSLLGPPPFVERMPIAPPRTPFRSTQSATKPPTNWGAKHRRGRRKGAASAQAEATQRAEPPRQYPQMGGILGSDMRLSHVGVHGFGDAITVINGTLDADNLHVSDNRRSIVGRDATINLSDSEIE
jgi:hypothetical protein